MIIKKEQNKDHTLHQTTGELVDQPVLSPISYLESSVAMCVAKTLDFFNERDGLDLSGYTITVTAKIDPTLIPKRVSDVKVSIDFSDSIDQTLAKTLRLKAKRGCVIGHTLEHSVNVELVND